MRARTRRQLGEQVAHVRLHRTSIVLSDPHQRHILTVDDRTRTSAGALMARH